MTTLEKQKNFKKQLKFGQNGERIILNYLVEKEDRICLPMYQFENEKSPLWITRSGYIKSPDIVTINKRGETIFVECKRKNGWVEGYKQETERETGFDLRSFNHYRELVLKTGIKIEVYFLHEDRKPTGLYKINLTEDTFREFMYHQNIFRIATHYRDHEVDARLIHFPYERLIKLY